MAFKIIQKIKPREIEEKSLDMLMMPKYYKMLQKKLIQLTNAQTTASYFFAGDFVEGENLLIVGNQTPAYKKIFRAAGKGKIGFDKTKVSIGLCYIEGSNGKFTLNIVPNNSMAKGKKMFVIKSLRKHCKRYMKSIHAIAWLDQIADGQASDELDQNSSENTVDQSASIDNKESASKQTISYAVKADEIVKRTKDIKKALEMLQKDIMPRYKQGESTERDQSFVNALIKAANLFLTKLSLADPAVAEKFSTQKQKIEEGLTQWEILAKRLLEKKNKSSANEALKADLKKTVQIINNYRNEIKEILKRVDLSAY